MSTLVASTNIKFSDRRMQRLLSEFRTSHGDLTNFRQLDLQLARGEDEEFTFDRCMYMWIRDVTTVEISQLDSTGAVVGVPLVFENVVGMIAWPTKAKIKLSVPADSTISLERVIKVVYA